MVIRCDSIPPLYVAGLAALIPGLWQIAKELRAWGLRAFDTAPAGVCLFEALGISGFRVLVYPAVFMVHPLEAANLSQVWIVGAMMAGLLLAGERPGARHWLGGLCAAAGVGACVAGGLGAGHVLALCGGLCWAWYVAKSPYGPERGASASAIASVTSGGGIMLLAFLAGNVLEIEGSAWLWLAFLLLVSSVGLTLWQYGVRHGATRARKISVLFAPVATVAWIWILTGIEPDAPGLFATAAMTAAGLIASPHVFRAAKTVRE